MFAAGLSCPEKSGEGLGTGPKLPVSNNLEGPGTKKSQDIKSIHWVNSSAQGSCFHKMTADVSSG